MEFVAIDVETANVDESSICQIGAAHFREGVVVEEWVSYIDPEDYFSNKNIGIHGIDSVTVSGAPTFSEIASSLNQFLEQKIVVCHTPFDQRAINRVAEKNGVPVPNCIWLDSSLVARRTWDGISKSGYNLANVCKIIGYKFQHHDALEDAKAAGQVILAAMLHVGLDLDGLIKKTAKPRNRKYPPSIKMEGNQAGVLYGEVIVFTGALDISRPEAAKMAASIGCDVAKSVTKKTTFLVVGDQDVKLLAGHKKSSKHRKAEELIQKGQSLKILIESDFKQLVEESV